MYLSARQIEDMEKLKHKFAAKKNPVSWRFTGGRSRGFWGKSTQRYYSPSFYPYDLLRDFKGGQQQFQACWDPDSKNARGWGQYRPRR
ncbi:hypothetical protein E2C01_021128 [Portunus trituberculatus]|uniref:Uncharacterized protein n=1 Tax=Portunus trituberculatus TaxID=210409 RepID=A0A5B7E2F4_PORTR|nr:hypothetical protein [Portunus trituberculatus]